MAEMEWKNAVAQTIETDDDLVFYAQSANRLAGLLYLKADYAEVIRVALPAIRLLEEKHYTMNNDYSNLLTFVGSCELKLGHPADAARNYDQAWQAYQQITQANYNIDSYTSSIVGLVTIVDAYIQTGHYQETLSRSLGLDHSSWQYASTMSPVARRARFVYRQAVGATLSLPCFCFRGIR